MPRGAKDPFVFIRWAAPASEWATEQELAAPSPVAPPRTRWLIVVPLAIAIGHLLRIGPQLVDRAYVSFRYAANAAAGHGLVFNLGQPVEGYSNLLWTLMLAAPAHAHWNIPHTALLLDGGLLLASLVLTWHACVLATGSRVTALTVSSVLALSTNLVGSSALGLEAPLYMFGLCLVLVGTIDERARGTWIFAAGAIVVGTARTEGILLAPMLAVLFVLSRRWRKLPVVAPVLMLVLLMGGLAACKLWEHARYGYWLPMSVLTRMDRDADLITGFQRAAPAGLDYLQTHLGWPWLVAMGISLLPMLRLSPSSKSFHGSLMAIVATGLGVAVCLWSRGDGLPFVQIIMPYLPMLLVAAGLCMHALLFESGHTFRRAGIVVVLWGVVLVTLESRPAVARVPAHNPFDDVGRIIAHAASPDDISATTMLGHVGFFAGTANVTGLFGAIEPNIALQPIAGSLRGKQLPEYTAGLRPVVIAADTWKSVAKIVQVSSDDYAVLTSPEMMREHLYVAVRSDRVAQMSPLFHARFGSVAETFRAGLRDWKSGRAPP